MEYYIAVKMGEQCYMHHRDEYEYCNFEWKKKKEAS